MKKALIVGDSHVDWGHFGKELAAQLRTLGYAVTKAGVGGTSARSWAKPRVCTPNKKRCLDVAPLRGAWDLVLISLGTNDAANANRAGGGEARFRETASRVDALARTLGGKRTVWILPPTLRGNVSWYTQAAADSLYAQAHRAREVVPFDSRPSTREVVTRKSGDGVHPGLVVSRKWASAVTKAAQRPSLRGVWISAAALLLLTIGVRLAQK